MAKVEVFIIESSSPRDFYDDQLDGNVTERLLKLLRIRSTLRTALNGTRFSKALKEAASSGANVLHISCHGSSSGIALADGTRLRWTDMAAEFQSYKLVPEALVMSACCGASSDAADAFEQRRTQPHIIFGSTDARYYDDYAAAWAILYRIFRNEGVNRDAAQKALAHITAVIHPNFRYQRWDGRRDQYLRYPASDSNFGVVDTAGLKNVEVIRP